MKTTTKPLPTTVKGSLGATNSEWNDFFIKVQLRHLDFTLEQIKYKIIGMRLRAANSFPCDYKFIKDVNFDHFFSNTSVEFNTFTL